MTASSEMKLRSVLLKLNRYPLPPPTYHRIPVNKTIKKASSPLQLCFKKSWQIYDSRSFIRDNRLHESTVNG